MIKLGGNSFFAYKVAFANNLYDVCEKSGIDYKTVLEGMAADKRIGRTHLKIVHNGYRGYGGKCLPKDTKALLEYAKSLKVEMPILSTTDKYNDNLLRSQGLDPLNTDINPQVHKDTELSYSISKEVKHK
jgi:UDP-glucose 6-dehydrogenase